MHTIIASLFILSALLTSHHYPYENPDNDNVNNSTYDNRNNNDSNIKIQPQRVRCDAPLKHLL